MADVLRIHYHRDFDGLVSAAVLATLLRECGREQELDVGPVDPRPRDRAGVLARAPSLRGREPEAAPESAGEGVRHLEAVIKNMQDEKQAGADEKPDDGEYIDAEYDQK